MRVTLLFVIAWLSLFGLYLLLVGEAPLPELVAGGLCAAVATGYHGLVYRLERPRFLFKVPWLPLAGRVVRAIVRDTVLVSLGLMRVILGRPLHGSVTQESFEPGDATPQDAARRALAVFAASLAPNSYVLDMPERLRCLRLHRLVPSRPSGDKLWPV